MADGRELIGTASGVRSLDRPHDAQLADLHRLWEAKRGGRALPTRADFDPAEFRRLLPNVLLLDILPPPDLYRVRLSGGAINDFYGRSITGLTPREYMGPDAALAISGVIETLVTTRKPVFRSGRTYWQADKSYKRFENCMLPLGGDGETVDMVLVAIKFAA
jgi:hypothetical protein